MHHPIIESFPSKRNHVFLTEIQSKKVVIKEFTQIENMEIELSIHNKISPRLATPAILTTYDNTIEYEYIPGKTLLHLLESHSITPDIITELIQWLQEFYSSTGMILGDAHFRNFIYYNRIYGFDFETAKRGLPEEDIANLILFALTYYPMFTDDKIEIAKTIAEIGIERLELNKDILFKEMIYSKNQLEKRRNKMLLQTTEWEVLFLEVL